MSACLVIFFFFFFFNHGIFLLIHHVSQSYSFPSPSVSSLTFITSPRKINYKIKIKINTPKTKQEQQKRKPSRPPLGQRPAPLSPAAFSQSLHGGCVSSSALHSPLHLSCLSITYSFVVVALEAAVCHAVYIPLCPKSFTCKCSLQ